MPTPPARRRLPFRAHLSAFAVLAALLVPAVAPAQSASLTDAQAAYAAPHFFELLLKFDSLLATKGNVGAGVSVDLVALHSDALERLRKIVQGGTTAPAVYSVESTAPGQALAALTQKWTAATTVRWADVVADLQPVCKSWKNYLDPWFDASRGADAKRGVFVMSIYSMSTIRCAPADDAPRPSNVSPAPPTPAPTSDFPSTAMTDANYQTMLGAKGVHVVYATNATNPNVRMMNPVMARLPFQPSQFTLWRLDVDQAPKAGSTIRVTGVPSVIVFRDGKELKRILGLVPKSKVEEIIRSALP